MNLLEETNASGAAQADYIYLNGRPVAVLNGSTLYYLHDDMLGTPQLATDSNHAVQWQASYDAFGQASVSGTVTQNLRFPGQYFDVESGWNHNGFRDYAPTLGRYIGPDPLGRLGRQVARSLTVLLISPWLEVVPRSSQSYCDERALSQERRGLAQVPGLKSMHHKKGWLPQVPRLWAPGKPPPPPRPLKLRADGCFSSSPSRQTIL